MLVEKAMEYEKTSYRGLFNFVRYIQKLQQYQVDYGEVNLSGAGESAVQIMTIHKSKGLEFPVVFAAGMGKRFNFRDMNASILIHPELGIGADAILPEKRIIAPSLCRQIIRESAPDGKPRRGAEGTLCSAYTCKGKTDPQWNYWSPASGIGGIVRIKGQ